MLDSLASFHTLRTTHLAQAFKLVKVAEHLRLVSNHIVIAFISVYIISSVCIQRLRNPTSGSTLEQKRRRRSIHQSLVGGCHSAVLSSPFDEATIVLQKRLGPICKKRWLSRWTETVSTIGLSVNSLTAVIRLYAKEIRERHIQVH